MCEPVSIAELLAHPFNAMRLQHIHHSERHNPVSALNRYARMLTPAPPITIAHDAATCSMAATDWPWPPWASNPTLWPTAKR